MNKKHTTYYFLTLLFFIFWGTSDDVLRASPLASDTVAIETQDNELPLFIFTRTQEVANFRNDSIQSFREQAIFAAKNDDVERAAFYAKKYIIYSGETSFLEYGYFKQFNDTKAFTLLRDQYSLSINWLNFFYLFSALIGFFIGFMLLLRKHQDKWSKLLVGMFVLIHSLFIFHIFLYQTKLLYDVPHVLYMSSIFSYLYGPLIYFYYKRVSQNYQFKKIDILHLIPTFIILVLMFPIFLLPAEEKHRIMLEVGIVDKQPYLIYISTTKFISLLVYGILVLRTHLKNKNNTNLSMPAQKWIRNLVVLTSIYVGSYLIYAFTIINVFPRFDVLYNLQILAMATMVLYIGYTSYLRPNLFSSDFITKKRKYKKSGLTPSYSLELKYQLLELLDAEKIYRQNDISLAKISEMIGTTRHNTSQVINEHFGLNFFELINSYRIKEAQEILKNDIHKKLNIIDVAYEVGFNNKVTFNKSFRKQLSITPSQFLNSLRA